MVLSNVFWFGLQNHIVHSQYYFWFGNHKNMHKKKEGEKKKHISRSISGFLDLIFCI